MIATPFFLTPKYCDYVWGGSRLRPQQTPTAEAWLIYEENRAANGPYSGFALSELSLQFGIDLLGKKAFAQTGKRFPLLVKILDCAQWLSLQVHPNDEQARHLEGENFFGKTEAWYVLDAEPDAQWIAGVKPNVSSAQLRSAIESKSEALLDLLQTTNAKKGDTLLVNPGMLHALGPGLLIYEVQQTSDITYRAYDWGRPETEARHLHIEKAVAVSDVNAQAQTASAPLLKDGEMQTLIRSAYFHMDLIEVEKKTVALETRRESFHGLTVAEGQVQVSAGKETFTLNPFEALFIPAGCEAYQIQPLKKSRILKIGV